MADRRVAPPVGPEDALNEGLAAFGAHAPALEAPIRSVLFGQARLEQHGRSLAESHAVVRGSRLGATFLPRVRENLHILQQARVVLERHAAEGLHIGPAARWLLDSATLLDEQLRDIRSQLPRSFFSRLPRLRDEPLAGLPRIYGVAWAWVAHTDSGLDATLLTAYLKAYQQQRALTLSELWALPTTLRAVLLENLRRLAERIALQQVARDAAHHWFDQSDGQRTLQALDALADRLARRGVLEPFLLQLQQREDELPASQARELGAWLMLRLPDAAGLLARQQAEATEDHQSIRNALTTLRHLDRVDWRAVISDSCAVMQTLGRCPVHALERDDTQNDTLRAVEKLARKARLEEDAVAQVLLRLTGSAADAQAPQAAAAYWWCGPGLNPLRTALGLRSRQWRASSAPVRRVTAWAYLGSLALLSAGGIAWLLHNQARPDAGWPLLAFTALLLLGPATEAVVAMVNRLISESARPAHLPRLALQTGIPSDHRTLVVIPAILNSTAAAQVLCEQLEQHCIANPEREAQFALLSDWADADRADAPDDAALLAAAEAGVRELNRRHPPADGATPRFLLLHRRRSWSDSEQRWIGWERKRGKLEELVRLLCEPSSRPFVDLGELSRPRPDTRYVVTLDADTDMPPGRLRDLVGVAAHPLNQPRLDAQRRRVVAGYGILQPRVVTPLPAPETVTLFHRLFAGQCGIDPYSASSSEIYQDLFGEGTFTGKGLLVVQAVHATLVGRLPDGQVLSHDLLEGSLARCAALSDVTLVEDAPVHADVAHSRLHRWTRGDWQLWPFLWHAQRLGLPLINRWKIVDNLRRSLVAPASLALLLLVLATGVLPVAWTLGVVAAAFCAGPLLGAVAGLAPSRDDIALPLFYRHAVADLGRALGLALWHLAQLLHLALLYADAIALSVYRQLVSRRGLLQWTTAAAALAAARQRLPDLLRQHRRVPAAAALLGALLAAASLAGSPVQAGWAAVLLTAWAASPLWTWMASRARPPPRRERLDDIDRAWLHGVARDTWRYYERHVGAEDHHLPPDNVQFTPHATVAHRTSPTNIGMYMLGAACAQALGFITRQDMVERLEATLDTLERLPRHRGHFYNWYDTQTLAVMPPAYISTVDSGNCSGHLLAVARACEVLAAAPQAAVAGGVLGSRGQRAALAASAQRLRVLLPMLDSSATLLSLAALARLDADLPAQDPQVLSEELRRARLELDALNLPRNETGEHAGLHLLQDHLLLLDAVLRDAHEGTAELMQRLRALAARCRALALAADYRMLYDRQRKLLHIGYRVEQQQLDDNHYDLLASEARLTSLLAIAKGDVPVAHWAALGRPFFAWGFEVGLKSWSGSMFEYLMPSLILDEPIGSVLHQSTRSAVAAQREEAVGQATPWGLSESAIAEQDHTLAYQYGAQGVPALALRRTPADERVVAPYASALALMVAPGAAVTNLRLLQAQGARRALGFIEAIDYTPQRQAAGSSHVQVHSFMAHHQAMSLVALTDVLCDGAPRRWAMSDPLLRATTALLHERAPREVPVLHVPPPPLAPRRLRSARLVSAAAPLEEALTTTQLLTNGRHAVGLRSHGGGWSQWEGLGITRWRDDLLRDDRGTFFFLRRDGAPDWHSLTAHPAADPAARYHCRHQADRTVFEATWPDLEARCAVWVSPEDDCELRQVELCNTGRQPITLTLASLAEITLAPQRADESHPAFSNLFVRASWDAAEQALYLQRRPRLPADQPVLAAHFLALADGAVPGLLACADRARVLGRHGRSGQLLGDGGLLQLSAEGPPDPETDLPGVPVDTGLDPVASLRLRVELAPGASLSYTFCTAASRQLEPLQALIDKYRHTSHTARASSMSHTMAGIRLRELQFDADTWAAMLCVNTLVTALTHRELPAQARSVAGASAARCDRRLLWRHALSGERPILLVHISSEQGLMLLQGLKKALRWWTSNGLGVDLVALNAEPASYLSPVQHALQQLRDRLHMQTHTLPLAQRSVLHVLSDAALSADERFTLQSLARVRLHADGRSLAQQIDRLLEEHEQQRLRRQGVPSVAVAPAWPQDQPQGLPQPPAWRFDGAMNDLVFQVSTRQMPSRPWINLLANPDFGCQVSEMGAGFTWAGNSRMHQITGWSNDALCDPPAEWLLLHDPESGRVWPLGQSLQGEPAREVRHGLGFTQMRQRIDGLDVTLTWCVDSAQPIKQLQVRLRQASPGRARRLRLVAMAEWQLGGQRGERLTLATRALPLAPQAPGVGLPRPGPTLALLATQLDHQGGFGGATAFLALRPALAAGPATQSPLIDWTCDRRELHDSSGRLVLPLRLGQLQGSGLDACAALGCKLTVPEGGEWSAAVLLGHAANADAAQLLLHEAWAVDPDARLAQQQGQWPARLGRQVVQTPDPAFDALVNHWLPYQTVVARLYARAGFYQAGGAFGFRDQLQDAVSMVGREPGLLARQIRSNAAHQFPPGDVQHWWHEPGGAGVRTHFSDDLLWLPWACALYVQRTGHYALLDEQLPFLDGAAVPEGQEDIYETPRPGQDSASIYEHAARAIDHSLRTGSHGLPLMGSGDWNDGMNRVGHQGRGESVWLAWFLCSVVDAMLPLAHARNDVARQQIWRQARRGWAAALEREGWDGRWYRRGFFDDGSPLGSASNTECRIDLIAQAWSVLSGAGDPARARQAMASAQELLVDPAAGLVRLLDPPLQHARPSAGYIQAYPEGVRENGGQYNHASVWAMMALARQGQAAAAWQLFTYMSPAHRWSDPARGAAYGLEPHVMAGDIYSHAPRVGRGGWSWYTGSAGWLARAAVETLCGVVVLHDAVHLQPCLPPHWPQARVALHLDARRITVVLCRALPLFERMLAENPGARVVEVGESVPLTGVADSELWLVLCGSAPPVDAARGAVQQAAAGLSEAALTPPLAGC